MSLPAIPINAAMPTTEPPPPRLLDRVREACRVRHYSNGKGGKDRRTMLPAAAKAELLMQVDRAQVA